MRSSFPPGTAIKKGYRRQGPARPTTARGPRYGVVFSLALHAALIGGTYLTWHRVIETHDGSHAVPVDLVTVAEATNVAAMAPPQPPPPKVDVPPPQIDQPDLPDFADVEPSPDPPVPEFKIKPQKMEDQPRDQPKNKKQAQQDLDAVLNKILAPQKAPKNAKTGPRVVQGIGNQNMMTADLADALKSQIDRCWTPPIGAPNAADLVVDLDVQLNPDGTVSGRPQLSGNSASAMGNSYTRAAADAAFRAIYQCQPYKLPADRYNQWREINPLRFDPRTMMGQ